MDGTCGLRRSRAGTASTEHDRQATPFVEVEIREGDIRVRDPLAVDDYWGEPPLSEMADGWFNTGRTDYFDNDGTLT